MRVSTTALVAASAGSVLSQNVTTGVSDPSAPIQKDRELIHDS